jgi:hypothetical protein
MMRAAAHACLLAAWAVGLAYAPAAHAQAGAQRSSKAARGEGIAAVVGDGAPGHGADVLLHSDVELRARLRLLGSGAAAEAPLSETAMRVALDELVGEVLIAREAERVQVAQPAAAEVEAEVARLERLAGGPQATGRLLRVLGASQDELRSMARRRAIVEAFLRANLEGTTMVTDAELARLYEAGEHPFVGRPLAEVAPSLRAWLAAQALERAVRRWVSVLRARTPVRLLASYAAPEG